MNRLPHPSLAILAILIAPVLRAQAWEISANLTDWPITAQLHATVIAPEAARSAPLSSLGKFDPSIPLASRVTTPSDIVLQRLRGPARRTITVHELTAAERVKVENALRQLPRFSREALMEHVRSISFVDDLGNNAITIKEAGSTRSIFDIVLRAGLVNENVSEFLTRKERNCYAESSSGETVSVEAGSLPALLYVLLHESVHVVDISNRTGQEGPPQLFKNGAPNQLVQDIWDHATTAVPAYRSPLLEGSYFRTGKKRSMDQAEPTYQTLARTPFISLYGSSNWYDDLAELVTWYYLTQKLHQPYRIVLRRGNIVLYSLDPANLKLVTDRFGAITPLFK